MMGPDILLILIFGYATSAVCFGLGLKYRDGLMVMLSLVLGLALAIVHTYIAGA